MSDSTRAKLVKYVDTATDLAESVKRNIMHGQKVNGEIVAVIDDKTVVALNAFQIAANSIKDLTDEMSAINIKFNN